MSNNLPINRIVSLFILSVVVLFPLRLQANQIQDISFKFPPDTEPIALFDLYRNGELKAENVPVWRPLNFFPRANDFVSNQKRAEANVRLQFRKAVRAKVDTGLRSIHYQSLPNPYYGKFSWGKPASWSRHQIESIPVSVNVHPSAADLIKWIDVLVNGESVVFREKIDGDFQTDLNLEKNLDHQKNKIQVKVRLLDRWGNSVTTPERAIHVEG